MSATISGCTFANNTAGNTNALFATTTGGAIAVLGAVNLNVSSSTFTDNSAISNTDFGFFNSGSDGGAIYIDNTDFFGSTPATLNVTTSSFVGNNAVGWATSGGAVYVNFGVVTKELVPNQLVLLGGADRVGQRERARRAKREPAEDIGQLIQQTPCACPFCVRGRSPS